MASPYILYLEEALLTKICSPKGLNTLMIIRSTCKCNDYNISSTPQNAYLCLLISEIS